MHDVGIHGLIVSHLVGADFHLVIALIEARSPETEGGIGADIAAAVAHEHEVLHAVAAGVPIHDGVS